MSSVRFWPLAALREGLLWVGCRPSRQAKFGQKRALLVSGTQQRSHCPRFTLTILPTRITAAAEPGTHEEMTMERTRAWRRTQARKHGNDKAVDPLKFKPEKNWKLMYTRADKLVRARQLGMSYPIRTTRQLLDQA